MHLFTKHTSLVTNKGMKYGTQFLTIARTWFQQFFNMFLPFICLQSFTAMTINTAVLLVLTIFQRDTLSPILGLKKLGPRRNEIILVKMCFNYISKLQGMGSIRTIQGGEGR